MPSLDITSPSPRRRALAAAIALAATLTAAQAAGAATVSLVTTTLSSGPVSTLSFADPAGERNDVRVKVTTTSVLVTDSAAGPAAAAGCAQSPDPTTVVCPLAEGHPALLVDVQGGGGDDALTLLEPDEPEVFDAVVAFLDGGDGNDRLSGTGYDTDSVLLTTLLIGGAGDDILAGGSGEDHLYGGAGSDTLTGAGDDDELEGDGSGRTVAQFKLVLAGKNFERTPPAPPADDVLDGGPGNDSANYPGRTQPLRVDLADPAPDGSPGEADRLAGIEDVLGGSGPNVLLGDAGDNGFQGSAVAPDLLDGRGGDDTLFGTSAGDVLRGGAGDDYLERPGPGSSCGAGRDQVRNPRSAPRVLQPLAYGGCELRALARRRREPARRAGAPARGRLHDRRRHVAPRGRRRRARALCDRDRQRAAGRVACGAPPRPPGPGAAADAAPARPPARRDDRQGRPLREGHLPPLAVRRASAEALSRGVATLASRWRGRSGSTT